MATKTATKYKTAMSFKILNQPESIEKLAETFRKPGDVSIKTL